MTTRIPKRTTDPLIQQFGLGVNSAASDAFVQPRECVKGQNLILKPSNTDFITRPPFDLIAQVPNGQAIKGMAFLHHPVFPQPSMLIQAGSSIYEWDGTTTSSAPFSLVGTCNGNARLRGRIWSHQWPLGATPVVIITDLELVEPIRVWDGTTLQTPSYHENDSAAFGNFYARYCVVRDERAYYGAVRDPGGAFEHVLVGSAIGDYETINVDNSQPSLADAFFIVTPDLRDINGMVSAFGLVGISTEQGSVWKLTGSDATDFALESLYPGSAAVGDESFTYVGNDIAYGRQGRIESLLATDRFGDVSSADLTRPISDQVESVASWTIVYNSRNQRVYCLPENGAKVWVQFKEILEEGVGSPWMLWNTQHDMAFQPTCIMNGFSPADGLEYVYMGDNSGNLYQLEGTYGQGGDGGDTDVVSDYTTRLYSNGADALMFDLDGWIRAKSSVSSTVNVTMSYVDEAGVKEDSIETVIPNPGGVVHYYGGSGTEAAYYGDPNVFYSRQGRGQFARLKAGWVGSAHDLQIRVEVTGDDETTIGEVGLRGKSAK